jgi:DNA polymerase-3 subunit epsilon
MTAAGFAVVDVETTGFSPKRGDRIVEIAIVHLSPEGEIENSWDTLVNPRRDVGATHVHGITSSDVAHAPVVEDLTPRVLNLLSERVLVAHNLAFDLRFLSAELSYISDEDLVLELNGSILFTSICTMQLASSFFPGSARSLDVCCQQASIERAHSHSALADARDTGRLLSHYMSRSRTNPFWAERLAHAQRWRFDESRVPEWAPRGSGARVRQHFIDRLFDAIDTPQAPGAELDYLGLLDRALLDGYLSAVEQDDLVDAARSLGLGRADVERLNSEYFEHIASIAWSDGELSLDEADELLAIAAALRLERSHVELALAPSALDTSADATKGARFSIEPGDTIVLTGDMSRSRPDWERHLAALGYRTAGSVSKKTAAVAAADAETLSGKAKRAHELGIPVITEAKLANLVGGWPT